MKGTKNKTVSKNVFIEADEYMLDNLMVMIANSIRPILAIARKVSILRILPNINSIDTSDIFRHP